MARGFRRAGLLPFLLAPGGCGGPFSTLDPAGPMAASVARLWWVMLGGSALLFMLVMALLLLAFLRPGIAARTGERLWLFWVGLVMPGLVLAALLVFALASGERLLAHPGTPGVLRVEARPQQWVWRFTYPEAPREVQGPEGVMETAGLLHIPAGRPVDVHVIGGDVIHSFWVPRLGGKMDAIPGHTNILRLQATEPGLYDGLCAEFCGTFHAEMRFAVQAHPAEEYEAILGRLASRLPVPALPRGVPEPDARERDAVGSVPVGRSPDGERLDGQTQGGQAP